MDDGYKRQGKKMISITNCCHFNAKAPEGKTQERAVGSSCAILLQRMV
jgi:hypothetical protein